MTQDYTLQNNPWMNVIFSWHFSKIVNLYCNCSQVYFFRLKYLIWNLSKRGYKMSKHLTPRYQFRQKWGDFSLSSVAGSSHIIWRVCDCWSDYAAEDNISLHLQSCHTVTRCAAEGGGQMQILINKTNIQLPAAATAPSLCRPQHEYYN